MDLREAGDKLGVSPATLRQQIKNGRLRAAKHGRDWYVTPGAVERYRELYAGRPGRKATPRKRLP